MRWLAGMAAAVLVVVAPFAGAGGACAEIVVAINKSKQRMIVRVDGVDRYEWKISSGLRGGPPSGTYHPERLERKWFSHKYNWSPMPHSIFFHKGYAIHGTTYVSRLGKRASHGCVRLHPSHAATLFELVRSRGMGNTTIVVSNSDVAVRPIPPPESGKRKATAVPPTPHAPAAMTVNGTTGTVPVVPRPDAATAIEE